MDADLTIGALGHAKSDLIGAVAFDATYVYFHEVWPQTRRRACFFGLGGSQGQGMGFG